MCVHIRTYILMYLHKFCIQLFGLVLVHFLYHKANDVMTEGQSIECITGWLEEYVSEVVTDCYHEEMFAESTKRQKQVCTLMLVRDHEDQHINYCHGGVFCILYVCTYISTYLLNVHSSVAYILIHEMLTDDFMLLPALVYTLFLMA